MDGVPAVDVTSQEIAARAKEEDLSLSLAVNASPHLRDKETVVSIMFGVILALVPVIAASVWFFRMRAVMLIGTAVLTCLATEYVMQKIRGKKITVFDGSAIITGILFALTLPPSLPVYAVIVGGVAAVALGKQLFGGLGHNIFNPALVGRAFLMAAYPVMMTTWNAPAHDWVSLGTTTATPLALMKFNRVAESWTSMLVGNIGGSLGETSALAILLGGMYLLYKRYIDWRIPVSYLGSTFIVGGILWLLFPQVAFNPVFHLLSGGLMLGAFFMATDMVTSPITPLGSWIFGIGAGIIVVIIRLFGGLPEGVMYSILFMNALTPLINRYTKPRMLGA